MSETLHAPQHFDLAPHFQIGKIAGVNHEVNDRPHKQPVGGLASCKAYHTLTTVSPTRIRSLSPDDRISQAGRFGYALMRKMSPLL
jgi:hypothetical protein